MSTFENVSITVKANQYFDGKVTSRTVVFADETKKTLGIMMPGEYEFGTSEKELMEITEGQLDVLLPGDSEWKSISAGESFYVPANASFKVKAISVVDYCCSYLPE